ncbi:MAG TPA: hypothetical protein VHM92_12585 [Allosphingosinicella sp.]|nr:hypothetical protein [Allosphingosinicella sp.]
MIARGFKSVIWAATVGGAALGCYMVSLRVATERNDLLGVEEQILAAKRDIRSLQTELGTRGRMTQLEQWNSEVLALSAPTSAQYMKDAYTLARLDRPEPTVAERSAEVHMASATGAAAAKPAPAAASAPVVVAAVASRPPQPAPLLRQASFMPAATAKPPVTTDTAKKRTPAKAAATESPAPAKAKPAVRLAQADPVKPKPGASAPARPRIGKLGAAIEAAAAREGGKGGGGR